jgi:UDP-2,3-diacylglucosamine pyrophosphatase LpxH
MAGKNPQTPKGQAAVQYLKDHPTMPLLTLAKLMHKEEPKVFTDVEQTRRMLRGYTGAGGKTTRIDPDKHGTRRVKGVSGADAWKEMMPESQHESLEPWVCPKSIRSILILSDVHIPYHSEAAVRLAIQHGIDNNVDAVLLNGDIMDMYSASQHEKDPRKRDLKNEIEQTKQFLSMLRKAFDGKPIYYRAANHEYRLERYLMKYAEILLGMPEFELPNLLGLRTLGIEYIRPQVPMHLGKLTVLHGDEYRGSGGVNPARWLSLRTGDNSMVGHFHRSSTHFDRTVRGDTRGWWSIGCLCCLDPEWLRFTQWQNGFAIVNLNPDGSFEVENFIIEKGKIR